MLWKFYRLTEFGKLRINEIVLFIITLVIGPLSLYLRVETFIITRCLLVIILLYLVVSIVKGNSKRDYPRGYKNSLYVSLFSSLLLLGLAYFYNKTAFSYGIMLDLFAIGYIGSNIIYYTLNFIYVLGLKRMFPSELRTKSKPINQLNNSKLSEFIELDKQMVFYNINLFNKMIYILVVFFFVILISKYSIVDQDILEGEISIWIKGQEWANFSNGIGVFSLFISIYSITIPIQRKIISEAVDRYNDKFKDYLG